MGFFSKLFEKKECSICGGEIGLLGNRKLEDGNCCKTCANKLSVWFDDRRHSTVEQIKAQLNARGENQQRLQTWHHDLEFGEYCKMYVQLQNGVPQSFVVTSSPDYREANADILPFSWVASCTPDIRESAMSSSVPTPRGSESATIRPGMSTATISTSSWIFRVVPISTIFPSGSIAPPWSWRL